MHVWHQLWHSNCWPSSVCFVPLPCAVMLFSSNPPHVPSLNTLILDENLIWLPYPKNLIPSSPSAACQSPVLKLPHHAFNRGGKDAGSLQADGRRGPARLGRRPARLWPEEEGGGQTGVSPNAILGFAPKIDETRGKSVYFCLRRMSECLIKVNSYCLRNQSWMLFCTVCTPEILTWYNTLFIKPKSQNMMQIKPMCACTCMHSCKSLTMKQNRIDKISMESRFFFFYFSRVLALNLMCWRKSKK